MFFHIQSSFFAFSLCMFHSFRNRATCQHFLRRKPSLFSANICPQRRNNLKLILSDFHKNASVFSHCAKKLCRFIVLPQCANKDYLFRIAECILYNENIPSFCATEKESPQFSPVELSSPGNLHFPVLCPVRAMVPLSSSHSYTGTGSRSPLCQT